MKKIKINKVFILIFIVLLLSAAVISLASCKDKGDNTGDMQYELTFDTGKGNPVQSIKGRVIDTAPIPEYDGHIFEGWYEQKDFSGHQVSFPYTLAGDTTLYARWYTEAQGSPYLEFSLADNTYIVSGYAGLSHILVIPSIYQNLPVTGIGDAAFTGCHTVEKIVIPASIKEIGKAFYRASSLKEISVKENNPNYKSVGGVLYDKNVTTIISYPPAKQDKEYIIPETVVTAEESSLRFAEHLEKVVIPASLTNVKTLFEGCYSIKEGAVSAENTAYKSLDGVLFTKNGEELLYFPPAKPAVSYNIPEGTLEVKAYAFDGCRTEEINIPQSLTIFPAVNSVNIKKFTVNANNLNFKAESGVLFNKEMTALLQYPRGKEGEAFDYSVNGNTETAYKYVIPEGVKTVADKSFSTPVRLNKVIFPASVETIGEYAFNNFEEAFELYEIEFAPASRLKTIKSNAFFNITSLKKATVTAIIPPQVGTLSFPQTVFEIHVPIETLENYTANWRIAGAEFKGTVVSAKFNLTLFNAESLAASTLVTAYVTQLPTPIRDGYVFAGWYDSESSGKRVSFPLGLYQDTSLYAAWSESYEGTQGLTYVQTENGITVTGYSGLEKEVYIPVSHNGQSVTAIAARAFYGKNHVETVHLPETIETIGEYAFAGSSSNNYMRLTEINLDITNITSIGKYAFQYCVFLEEIPLPDTLLQIDNHAFADCLNLESVFLPEKVEYLGDRVFSGCKKLGEITVHSGNPYFSGADGILYNKNFTELVKFPENKQTENFTVPASVTTLRAESFYGASIHTLTLGANTEQYQSGVFYNMAVHKVILAEGIGAFNFELFRYSALEIISIPASFSVFSPKMEGLNSLSEFIVSASNPDFKAVGGALFSKDGKILYRVPPKVRSFAVPEGTETLGSYAFAYGEINNVTLPSTLEVIGNSAFYGCGYISSLSIPGLVSEVGDEAFLRCDSLQNLRFSSDPSFGSNSVANGLKIIVPGEYLTHFSEALEKAVIISSDIVISGMRLELINDEYYKLLEIMDTSDIFVIPGTVNGIEIREIGSKAFNNIVKKVVIPDEVRIISTNAFNGENLTTIIFTDGENLTQFALSAFSNAKALRNLVIPALPAPLRDSSLFNLTNKELKIFAGENLIDYLSGLPLNVYPLSAVAGDYASVDGTLISYLGADSEITLPEGKTMVAEYFLPNFVRKVTLPSMITEIKSYAFSGLDSAVSQMLLNTLVFNDGLLSIGEKAFFGTDIKILDLPGTLETVSAESFENIINLQAINISGDTFVSEGGVLYSKDNKTLVYYPQGKTDSVFTVPASVENIGKKAFYQTNILTVILGSSLRSIGEYAFAGCNRLMKVTLPEGILTVGAFAFSSNGIIDLTLPSTLLDFPSTAVVDCVSLKNLYSLSDNFVSENGILYNADKTVLINYPASRTESFTVPESVTEIAPYAFYASKAQRIYIPGVAVIGEGAFAYSSLTEIEIGENVVALSEKAFLEASKLERVILPQGLRSIGNYAFYNCVNLKLLDMPAGLERLGDYALFGCALTSLTFGENTAIGDFAISNCLSLTSLILPQNLTDAGESILYGSYNVAVLKMNTEFSLFRLFGTMYPQSVTTIKIHEQPYTENHTLPERFFENNRCIVSVELPSSLGTIGSYAFNYCVSLTTVTFAGGYGYQRLENMGEYAFGNCPNLIRFESKSLLLGENISVKAFSVDDGGTTTAPANLKVYVNAEDLADYSEMLWAEGLTLLAA